MRIEDLQVALPAGWAAMDAEAIGRDGGGTAVVGYVREDEVARVLVLRDPPLAVSIHDAAIALRHRLREAIEDFRFINESLVTLPAGEALITSYARTRTGTAESVTIVPMDGCTYSLVTVVIAGEVDAANEAASIVASFGPVDGS